MGCNCGKPKPPGPQPGGGSGQQARFALDTNGVTQTFGSQLEAKAANARQGNRGTVRQLTRF